MAAPNDIVLFHYSYSPYARKVVWYLAFRGIDYAQCMQPPTLPRDDLSALGVQYRRIPVMSIGRDIYCDTRLIIAKLEQRFPNGLGASNPEEKALETLLHNWIDNAVFARAAQLIPPEAPLLNDPKFIKDREDYTGRSWSKASVTKMRPEALAHIRDAFEFLESGLLSDGRQWLLKTQKPSLTDIEAILPFHWLSGLKGALPLDLISAKQYPKVFAWIDRFDKAYLAAKAAAPKPKTLRGPEAVKAILESQFIEEVSVDGDPIQLAAGQDVEAWPVDSGFSRHEKGKLVGFSKDQIVLETEAKDGKVRVHYPRTNFRIRPSKL